MSNRLLFGSVACVLGVVAASRGETLDSDTIAARVPSHETGWEGDHLSGDWNGVRDILVDLGIHLSAGYTGEVLGNLSGGEKRGAIYEGLLELGLQVDFESMGLWEGGRFQVSSVFPHGRSLSEHYTGDLLTASNIDGYDSFRLYELWYEQNWFSDRLSVRVGQLAADEEFATTDAGSLFVNSGFGWPAFVSGNTLNGGPAYFAPAPGVRLMVEALPDELYFQAGIWDGDSFDSRAGDPRVNRSGTRIHFSADQGMFAMGEAGVLVNHQEGASGLPGTYKVGGWAHTGKFASNYRDRAGGSFVVSGLDPKEHGENYGFYLAAEQMVWREKPEGNEGLALFSRLGASPADRNLFELVYDGGVAYQGLVPGRDNDVFGAGVIYARLAEDIRKRERDERDLLGRSAPRSDHEFVLESFYSIQVKEWLVVQPDFQWIHHPGGSDANSDACVIGFRTTIVF